MIYNTQMLGILYLYIFLKLINYISYFSKRYDDDDDGKGATKASAPPLKKSSKAAAIIVLRGKGTAKK